MHKDIFPDAGITKGYKAEVSLMAYFVARRVPETLYHRDDALLYIAYVMLIWAAPIPDDRWHCSL